MGSLHRFSIAIAFAWPLGCRAVDEGPRRLEIPLETPTTFRIAQDSSAKVPGSRRTLRLVIGAIEADRITVSLVRADGQALIDAASMRAGDALTLGLPDEDRIVVLERTEREQDRPLVAVFAIRASHTWERQRIERLLKLVESSNAFFTREGKQYEGADAAAHLRRKLSHAGDRVKTLDEFIEHIASRSSTTGRPYQIKQPDGTIVEAARWMRQQSVGSLLTVRAASPP
jgi:hypothetical protein